VILRIWDHRSSDERVNPFAELKPIVSVLRSLAQSHAPWTFQPSKTSQLACQTYDALRRLTICLCLLEMGSITRVRKGLARAQKTTSHHDEHERALELFLAAWLLTFPSTATARSRPAAGDAARGPDDPRGAALGLARTARACLDQLITELTDDASAGKRPRRASRQTTH
jgi:hypothetical protein